MNTICHVGEILPCMHFFIGMEELHPHPFGSSAFHHKPIFQAYFGDDLLLQICQPDREGGRQKILLSWWTKIQEKNSLKPSEQ